MTRTHQRHLRDTERETQARGHLAPTCPEDARLTAPRHVGVSHPARCEQDVRPTALRWASRALLVLAAALISVDGTRFGLAMPFWTPLAPWPLMLYVILNCRELPGVVRRYRGYFLLPALFVAFSAIGWATVALHPVPAALSILGVIGALGCLAVIDIAVHTDPRRRASVVRAARRSVALVAGTVVVALANQRILSIMERGMLVGDGSLSARIAQGLTPIIAGVLQPLRLLVGFGAGNSIVAYQAGLDTAKSALSGLGKPSMWSWISRFTPEGSFTMSAYTSVITDFGLAGLAALVALVVRDARHARTACLAAGQRAEARTYLWWTILVAYLYLQFEGYAFYALPLLVWALRTRPLRIDEQA